MESLPSTASSRGNRVVTRERTAMSLAEFYAPTPDIPRDYPDPTRKTTETEEEHEGQRLRNCVRSTSDEECCEDVYPYKIELQCQAQDRDRTEDIKVGCVNSSLSFLADDDDDDNVASSVNSEVFTGVSDSVIHSATACGQRSEVKLDCGVDRRKSHVSDRETLMIPRKDILLSPNEQDEPVSHSADDSLTCEKTSQLLVTSTVKLIATTNSAGVSSVTSCDLRPTNHTVQCSTSYANRFVLPREKSVVSNKQMDFVQIMSDISQRTSDLLHLQRHHTVIGLDTGHSKDTYQGQSAIEVMWNRLRPRARPLGQVPPTGKKLKYHKFGAMGMDSGCPLLVGVTQPGGRRLREVSVLQSPHPPALQYHPVHSSGMSWKRPSVRPSAETLAATFGTTTYIERPPLHAKTTEARNRLSSGGLRGRLASRRNVRNTQNTNNSP